MTGYTIKHGGSVVELEAGHILAGEPGSADGRDVADAVREVAEVAEGILAGGKVRSVEVYAHDDDGGSMVDVYGEGR